MDEPYYVRVVCPTLGGIVGHLIKGRILRARLFERVYYMVWGLDEEESDATGGWDLDRFEKLSPLESLALAAE